MYVLIAVILYIRRSQVLLFCMYTCQIINKTQTIFEIDSGHFYCITKVHTINKDYQVIIHSFDNFMFQYIINCQRSLESLYQSIKDIKKITI